MNLAYNRKIASVVLIVCILGSIVGLGGNALRTDRSRVLKVFEEGTEREEGMRFSMDAYLDSSAEYALLMAEEYKLRTGSDASLCEKVGQLAKSVAENDDLTRRYADYKALDQEIEALYTAFFASGLSESDAAAADFKRAYRNFQSDANKIERDDYHALAGSYNDGLNGFPAGLVGKLVGATQLDPMQ